MKWLDVTDAAYFMRAASVASQEALVVNINLCYMWNLIDGAATVETVQDRATVKLGIDTLIDNISSFFCASVLKMV